MNIRNSLNNFALILLNPVLFFKNSNNLILKKYSVIVGWVIGIASAINRFDDEYKNKSRSLGSFLSVLSGNWFFYWMFILAMGAIGGLLLWYFNGLIYRTLIIWSKGNYANKADTREKRAYISLITAFPKIIYMIIVSILIRNYNNYWEISQIEIFIFTPLLLIEQIALLKVAIGIFNANKNRAIFWFIGLPIVLVFIIYFIINII